VDFLVANVPIANLGFEVALPTSIDLAVSGCGAGGGDTAMDCNVNFLFVRGAKFGALRLRRDEEKCLVSRRKVKRQG